MSSELQSLVAPSGERLWGKDAGLAESNDSLPSGDTVHQDQLRAQCSLMSKGEQYLYGIILAPMLYVILSNVHYKCSYNDDDDVILSFQAM